jgi:hypothetical protein
VTNYRLLQTESSSGFPQDALDHTDGDPVDLGDLGNGHSVLHPGSDAGMVRPRDLARGPGLGLGRCRDFLVTGRSRLRDRQHAWFPRGSLGPWHGISHGVDIPPFEKLRDFKTWEEEKPPAGTLYNYPPRRDVTALLAGYPAPTSLGAQMFAQGTICKMVAQCTQQGKSIDQAIDLARTELEGFKRT